MEEILYRKKGIKKLPPLGEAFGVVYFFTMMYS